MQPPWVVGNKVGQNLACISQSLAVETAVCHSLSLQPLRLSHHNRCPAGCKGGGGGIDSASNQWCNMLVCVWPGPPCWWRAWYI